MSTNIQKVLLIYGAGKGVGTATLKKFAAKGWKTAAVVRTLKDEYEGFADVVLPIDFADLDAVQKAYTDVESRLGTPNCVVYNCGCPLSPSSIHLRLWLLREVLTQSRSLAYSFSEMSAANNPFATPPAMFAKDMTVNAVGLYAAASSAVAGFAKLATSAEPKVFIFTGNAFPTLIVPEVPALGAGKSAGAYLIEAAARSFGGYRGGYKGVQGSSSSQWYFADERRADGRPVMGAIDGQAHADAYWDLVDRAGTQQPWNYTFVKGKGYVKFADVVDHAAATIGELM